jgi:hypothetical protein
MSALGRKRTLEATTFSAVARVKGHPAYDSGMTSPALESILFFEDLQAISRRKRLADVVRWAIAQEIPFKYDGRGGVWTTIDALNSSMGVVVTRFSGSDK